MIRKFILRISLFSVILVIPLFLFSFFIESSIHCFIKEKPLWVLEKKSQTFDYAIGGSSRAYNNADILTIDSLLNTKGINIAYSGSALAENYLTLDVFLKNNNRIKNYILQIDDLSLRVPDSTFMRPFHEYYFFPFMNDPEVCTIIKENTPTHKYFLWKYIPYVKYAEFNNIYPLFGNSDNKQGLGHEHTKGTMRLSKAHKFEEVSANELKSGQLPQKRFTRPVSLKSAQYLEKIIELCRSKNIKVILYTAPADPDYLRRLELSEWKTYIKQLTTRYRIPYFDMSSIPGLNRKEYMYDLTHLNTPGTLKFSAIFADTLSRALVK